MLLNVMNPLKNIIKVKTPNPRNWTYIKVTLAFQYLHCKSLIKYNS